MFYPEPPGLFLDPAGAEPLESSSTFTFAVFVYLWRSSFGPGVGKGGFEAQIPFRVCLFGQNTFGMWLLGPQKAPH